MRFKIELSGENIIVPMNYQPLLQGFIYSMFDKNEYGLFLHEQGYRLNEKVFKMFVFSNIFGQYSIEGSNFVFKNKICFYISSPSEEFNKAVYEFLNKNEKVVIGNNFLDITSVNIVDLKYFKGEKNITIKTLSPLVSYTTVGRKVEYIKPSDSQFEAYCLNNLYEKNKAYGDKLDNILFKINSIEYEKKRIVHFKNTFYVAYSARFNIKTNYETLSFLYDVGLSSKGSAGFGMIETKI